jgi:hypothetical protein
MELHLTAYVLLQLLLLLLSLKQLVLLPYNGGRMKQLGHAECKQLGGTKWTSECRGRVGICAHMYALTHTHTHIHTYTHT